MAAKKTNWGVIIAVAVILGLLYLYFKKKPATAGGGPSYGGGSGRPLVGSGGGGGPTGGGSGGGGGIPLNGLFGGNPLKNWIQKVLNQGWANAAQLPIDSSYIPGLGVSPDLSIPYQPMQLFDVNQTAQPLPYDLSQMSVTDPSLQSYIPYDSLQLFDVNQTAQDISQPADLSSYGIDPYYGADQLSTYSQDANSLSSYLDYSSQPILSYGDVYSGQGSQDLNPADYSIA